MYMAVIKQRLQEKDGLRTNVRSESMRIILISFYSLTSHFFIAAVHSCCFPRFLHKFVSLVRVKYLIFFVTFYETK